MENKDQGAPSARTAARCPICEQEIGSDPGDFGTRCIRKIMGAPSTAAMVCYRLGYERLLAVVEKYPCPHGRPLWRMCPHCLGINATSRAEPPAGPSGFCCDIRAVYGHGVHRTGCPGAQGEEK